MTCSNLFWMKELRATQDNISHSDGTVLICSTPTILQLMEEEIDTLFHEAEQEWSNINNRKATLATTGQAKATKPADNRVLAKPLSCNEIKTYGSESRGQERAKRSPFDIHHSPFDRHFSFRHLTS